MKANPPVQLPCKLYSADSVRELDRIAIEEYRVPGYELMQRAGKAVFDYLRSHYPISRRILVLCGAGNNAGDGYVVARLAARAGMDVEVVSLVDPGKLVGDARTAWQNWHSLGRQLGRFSVDLLAKADVVVDALLGTGLVRDVEGQWADVIREVNAADVPVIAVDIPSGLSADTGRVAGIAIEADATVSFIGLKKGLLTHHGVDHCGELVFDDLSIPQEVYRHVDHQAERMDWRELEQHLRPRRASTHKHQCGHVIVMGGDLGMPGAARMAAEASLRAGAGLVTVVTHPQHSEVILAGRPEIMLAPTVDGHVPAELLSKADALVVGPGLGDSHWSHNLLSVALESSRPKVLDAGALRMLDEEDGRRDDWILTPHAGEAAALLGETSQVVQDSRFASVELLQQKLGGHIVLKGAGSLVLSPGEKIQLCFAGNPGMATAGMGDVLSGLLGALLAQGYGFSLAARIGVCLHARAGDLAAQSGQAGLLATDLYPYIRQLVNRL